jgi:hypothetical protein
MYVVYRQIPNGTEEETIEDRVFTRLVKSFNEDVQYPDGTLGPRFKEVKR